MTTERKSPVGRRIGKYEIRRELGRGGMGVVYEAFDVPLQRPVAVKTLAAHLANDKTLFERMVREARAVARLSHPNIVTVHEIGTYDGAPCIVMEFVKGVPLSAYLERKGPLEPLTAANIVRQVACALDEAHRNGIIHRDIKPSNIMLCPNGAVKVMDFGLAKFWGSESDLTASGTQLGTPMYMSPEQWKSDPVDARTDIYSLGIVLFEMLAGKPPFRKGDTPLSIMRQVVDETFPDIRDLNPAIPPRLVEILTAMVAKDPDDRYPLTGRLIHDLNEFLRQGMGALSTTVPMGSPGVFPDLTSGEPRPGPPLEWPPKKNPGCVWRSVKIGALIGLGMLIMALLVANAVHRRKTRTSPSAPPPTAQPNAIAPERRTVELLETAWKMPDGETTFRFLPEGHLATKNEANPKDVRVQGQWERSGDTVTVRIGGRETAIKIRGKELMVEDVPLERGEWFDLRGILRRGSGLPNEPR